MKYFLWLEIHDSFLIPPEELNKVVKADEFTLLKVMLYLKQGVQLLC